MLVLFLLCTQGTVLLDRAVLLPSVLAVQVSVSVENSGLEIRYP